MSKDVLPALVTLLAERVGQERFDLWFGAHTRFTLDNSTLLVEAPNQFLQNWQRQHYRAPVETACREVLAGNAGAGDTTAENSVAVEFRANESLAPKSVLSCHESHRAPQAVENKFSASNIKIAPAGPVNGKHSAAEMDALPRRRFATLCSFVVGAPNRLAHASAHAAAERPGTVTPLLFYGPHGCGKTHLLEAIWTAAKAQNRGANCVYLSAEQFTTFYVAAARGSGMPSFRRKYRGVEILLIDDLQFLVGKKGTLVELLHTIDAALREGRQLVFAADRPPAELNGMGPELSTRLAGGMVCPLEVPDEDLRFGLVKEFGRRLTFDIPDDVARFVSSQVTAGARELCGAVNRMHATSKMLNCAIDLGVVQEALTDLLRQGGRTIRMLDIERAVCDVFSLPKESLKSERRAKQVNAARMLAMWLARKYTRAGLTEIGEYFGRRSHSTVISANKRVSDWIRVQSEIELDHSPCKIDDALRRVEARLRTG